MSVFSSAKELSRVEGDDLNLVVAKSERMMMNLYDDGNSCG